MRACEFLHEAEKSLTPTTITVGDEVHVGKYKNKRAKVQGFATDEHNQPVLKTNKGDQKLFKPRIAKLMVPVAEYIDVVEESIRSLINNMSPDEIVLLENSARNGFEKIKNDIERVDPNINKLTQSDIGKTFYPVSFFSFMVNPAFQITRPDSESILEDIDQNDCYYFKSKSGKRYKFPDKPDQGYYRRLIYPSKLAADHDITVIKYGAPEGWKFIDNNSTITEARIADMPEHEAKALPATYAIPKLPNQDPYKQYRFGVALAAAKGQAARAKEGAPPFSPATTWGENQIIVSYEPNIDEWIDDALVMVGLKPTDKVMISTRVSEEPTDTKTVSPVQAFKGYPR